MHYLKPALTFEQQADQLLQRGLLADRALLIERLRAVSYYRLSAYWHPFRQPDDSLQPGTTLALVWQRYVFDRRLRCLVIDAIERIEIAVRTRMANTLTVAHGPFGHTRAANLPGLSPVQHAEFLRRIEDETQNSRETFVDHFRTKYTAEPHLPLWMAVELMTFGATLTLFRGLDRRMKQQLAADLGIADTVLHSWLLALNQVRNICAHHGRLWNRQFGVQPMIPRPNKHPDWHFPVAVTGDRLFGVATVLHYLLDLIAPQSRWPARFMALLAAHPDIPRLPMGIPDNWQDCPLWPQPPAMID